MNLRSPFLEEMTAFSEKMMVAARLMVMVMMTITHPDDDDDGDNDEDDR